LSKPFSNILVSKDISNKRYGICKDCEEFIKLTSQCKQCGCFMKLKTKLFSAQCPKNKWQEKWTSEEW
jgi:hypothetical protein